MILSKFYLRKKSGTFMVKCGFRRDSKSGRRGHVQPNRLGPVRDGVLQVTQKMRTPFLEADFENSNAPRDLTDETAQMTSLCFPSHSLVNVKNDSFLVKVPKLLQMQFYLYQGETRQKSTKKMIKQNREKSRIDVFRTPQVQIDESFWILAWVFSF